MPGLYFEAKFNLTSTFYYIVIIPKTQVCFKSNDYQLFKYLQKCEETRVRSLKQCQAPGYTKSGVFIALTVTKLAGGPWKHS